MDTSRQSEFKPDNRLITPNHIDDLVDCRLDAGMNLTPDEEEIYEAFNQKPDEVDLQATYLALGGIDTFFEAKQNYKPKLSNRPRILGPRCSPFEE